MTAKPRIVLPLAALAAVMTLILLGLLTSGCSSSHHGSEEPPGPSTAVLVDSSMWGAWVCKDACGCRPPREFNVQSWSEATADDLCGTAWSCKYNCSSSCAGAGAPETAAGGDIPDPTVNVACLPFDGTGPVKFYRDRTIAHRARACIVGGVCYYGCS